MSRDESWDDLSRDQRRARRREYRERKEQQLDKYREHLDNLDLQEDEQADVYDRFRDLRAAKTKLRGRLQDLYDAGDHEWDGVRDDFDESWGEFESDWEDLSQLVKGRVDRSEDES